MLDHETVVKLTNLDGQVTRREGLMLADLAARVAKTYAIVEIGAYKGKSTCWLAAGAQDGKGAYVYSVDLWDPQAHSQGSIFAAPNIFDEWQRQTSEMGMSEFITPLKGASLDQAAQWDPKKKIGLLFIDGNHHYKQARADFDAWTQFVPKGGFVVIHDYGKPRWVKDVDRLVNETLKGDGWTEFEVAGRAAKARKA